MRVPSEVICRKQLSAELVPIADRPVPAIQSTKPALICSHPVNSGATQPKGWAASALANYY